MRINEVIQGHLVSWIKEAIDVNSRREDSKEKHPEIGGFNSSRIQK